MSHNIKPYHSSSNIYPVATSISQGRNINKALIIKYIQSCLSTISCSPTKSNACSCNYAWLTSLTSLYHNISAPMHQYMFVFICMFILLNACSCNYAWLTSLISLYHNISAPMHQYMFVFICMFILFIQDINSNNQINK